jgi:hypothetical protein
MTAESRRAAVAAYAARQKEKHAQNAEAVRVLFRIVMKLASSPAADISDEDAKLLNDIEARLKKQ